MSLILKNIIRSNKTEVKIGEWSEGEIPHAKFPLKKGKLRLGIGWEWRIASFDAMGENFNVLIALNLEKEIYRAILGMRDKNSLKIICTNELHTSHFDWHCHLVCGNVHETFSGAFRDKDRTRRYPNFASPDCTVAFYITKENALSRAAEVYRFSSKGTLL